MNLPLQRESTVALHIATDRRMRIRSVPLDISIFRKRILRRRQRNTARIGPGIGDLAEDRLQLRDRERHGRGRGRRNPGRRILAAGALPNGNTSLYILLLCELMMVVLRGAATAAAKEEGPFQGIPPTPRHNHAIIGMYLGGRGRGRGTDGGKGAPPIHCLRFWEQY